MNEDARIAEMEKRHAEMYERAFGGHVSTFDHNLGDAAALLKTEIVKAKEKRAKILAGVVEEKRPEPVPSHRRLPRNITSKEMREKAEAAAKPDLPPNDASWEDVAALYQGEHAFSMFEADFLELRGEVGEDVLCAFTQGEHTALLGMIFRVLAEMRATIHHAGNKRRLLEERVKALEAKPTMRYCGIWKDEPAYAPGDVTTHDGSMWIAREANIACRPSTTGDWQLCVKKGRDAR